MSDKKLLAIAKKYVTEEYAVIGERFYYWEELIDPHDDSSAHTVGGYAPPDHGSYWWAETVSCEVLGAKILEKSDDGVMIEVSAAIAEITSDADDTEPAAEERLISCWLERDNDGNWYVENAEE